MSSDPNQQKQLAADHAASYVQSGMVIGLGTGSTAILFLRRLAERLAAGDLTNIVGIPTSSQIATEAARLHFPLTTLEEQPVLDLTVDGADEVDPQLNLIKGGGGALLREKIVAQASKREVIIVDEAKLSPVLGTKWHVPIEVIPFGWRTQAAYLTGLGAKVVLRQAKEGASFVTDQGNYILDTHFGLIHDPAALAQTLNQRVGIVEHGLFVKLAHEVIVGGSAGVRILRPAGIN
ncbi:MAG: ribose-5-phosphate isomerase RpiA [Caldilinea sp. CFX5]|nr:ribose-5-phosphate isomerase RpiA [Caldilinea sp. CFX5]